VRPTQIPGLISRATEHRDRTALVEPGAACTYNRLIAAASHLAIAARASVCPGGV
jgi:hypothetical protein